jgi:xylulose-5-phosphate/fructose-6-phosphate phosphoketolase
VRGYKECGTTTTPFDMVVLNDLDRYHLVRDIAERVPQAADRADSLRALVQETLQRHRTYIRQYGEDLPEVRDWQWPG